MNSNLMCNEQRFTAFKVSHRIEILINNAIQQNHSHFKQEQSNHRAHVKKLNSQLLTRYILYIYILFDPVMLIVIIHVSYWTCSEQTPIAVYVYDICSVKWHKCNFGLV